MSVQFDAATCRALLNPDAGRVDIGGSGFIADWRRWTERERQDWVSLAAEGGILPDGYFDPALDLPPSMVLAPGGVCFIALSREEATNTPDGTPGADAPAGNPFATENGLDISRLPPSNILERVREFLSSIVDRVLRAIASGVDALRELVRRAVDALASLIPGGGWLLWAALAAGLLGLAWVAAGEGKGGAKRGK